MAKKKKSKTKSFVIKFILISLLVVGSCFAIGKGVAYTFGNSKYFKIKSVVSDSSLQFINKRDLKNFIGKNIFAVDLKAAQRRLSYKYPQASHLKVIRRFPNQIAIVAKHRLPFAQVKVAQKVVVVDEQGIVLSIGDKVAKKISIITGAKQKNQKLVLGFPIAGKDIQFALKMIRLFRADNSLTGYSILEIDIANSSKIDFVLSNKLHIIIDQERIAHRIRVLGVILAQDKIDFKDVKYIDLRFKEPIIGKK